jgi:hypothetical protein
MGQMSHVSARIPQSSVNQWREEEEGREGAMRCGVVWTTVCDLQVICGVLRMSGVVMSGVETLESNGESSEMCG